MGSGSRSTSEHETVSKSEFKARALEYFRRVQRTRKALVVTDRGRPVAKVVPFKDDPEETLRELRGSVLEYDDPTAPVPRIASS